MRKWMEFKVMGIIMGIVGVLGIYLVGGRRLIFIREDYLWILFLGVRGGD